MARPKSNEGMSKSDIVRAYLRTNPTASVNQIVEDLRADGITHATAQKIKYKDRARRGRGRKPGGSAVGSYTASEAAEPSKADHIRRVAQGMGKRVRPRDVIAALDVEGISVSFAQVGQVLKNMGMRRRPRSRGAAGRAGGGQAAAPVTISLEALIAAKKLADQLGGVQAAKQAMDALAKLS
jgi:hypothetical protein